MTRRLGIQCDYPSCGVVSDLTATSPSRLGWGELRISYNGQTTTVDLCPAHILQVLGVLDRIRPTGPPAVDIEELRRS